MVKVKSASEIDKNYRDAIGRVPGKYKSGVERTNDWQEKAAAGEDLYAAKVQEAVAARSREKGIMATTNEEWKSKAASLGAERIGRGMTENAAKRTRKFEPFRAALEGVTLPPRTADPMANVDARVKPIVEALVNTKKGQ